MDRLVCNPLTTTACGPVKKSVKSLPSCDFNVFDPNTKNFFDETDLKSTRGWHEIKLVLRLTGIQDEQMNR
jgi:hypothetical protein